MTSDLLFLWLFLVLILYALTILIDRAIDRFKQRHFDQRHDYHRTQRAEFDPDFNWPARVSEEER